MAFNLADVLGNVPYQGTGREQIEYIPLHQIDEDPNNFYQLSGLDELAANISLCGLQQPIRVRQKADGRYIIVSGHRRRAALEMLMQDDPEQWGEAPCIVERDAVSPTLQQLRLIYANANTRKMTSAEISEQAEQVEKLLYQLKEEGYEFPGRMRDHVAEAVGASKSKLARLKVIRENLDASWVDDWKNGRLTESQAYALAQMHPFWQSIIKEKWSYSTGSLYAERISMIRERFEGIQNIQCQHGLSVCEHSVTMMGKSVDYNGGCYHCCFECSNLQACKNCCPEAAGKKKELRDVAKAANQKAKDEQAERDRPGAEFARSVWNRIGEARKATGCSVEAVRRAGGESYVSSIDDPKQERMENGEGMYGPDIPVSFGYNVTARDLMKVVAVADALGCSIDYLLGRTDRMEVVPNSGTEPESEKVPYQDTGWQTGEPEECGLYMLCLCEDDWRHPWCDPWKWNGAYWEDCTGPHNPAIDGVIKGWIPIPEFPRMEVDG